MAACVRSALRHVVYFEPGPSSMEQYCLDEVRHKGRYTFQCPDSKCERVWEYFLVRHVACLDDETRSDIEKHVVENYIKHGRGYQQCPGCNTWCSPSKNGDIRLRCPMCSQSKVKPYDFCWTCQLEWRSTSLTRCGNEECNGKDPRLAILANAAKETIDDIPGCPSIRACPKCGLLIMWLGSCRHMTCTRKCCKNEFCFICLKPWESHNKDIHRQCPIAPVQVECPIAPVQVDSRDEYVSPTVTKANNGGCIIL